MTTSTSTSRSESLFCGAKPRMLLDLRKKVSKETRDRPFVFDIKAAAAEEEKEEYDGLEAEEPVTQKQQLWPRKRTAAHFLEPSTTEATKEATKRCSTQTSPLYETYIKVFENEGFSPIVMTHAYNPVSFAKDRKPAGQDPIFCESPICKTLHKACGPGQPVAVGIHQKCMSEHLKLWAASRAHDNTSPACSTRSSITPVPAGCLQLGAQAAASLPSSPTSVAPLPKRRAREEYRFLKIIIPGRIREKAGNHHHYVHRNCISRDEAAHDGSTLRTCGDDSAPSLS